MCWEHGVQGGFLDRSHIRAAGGLLGRSTALPPRPAASYISGGPGARGQQPMGREVDITLAFPSPVRVCCRQEGKVAGFLGAPCPGSLVPHVLGVG